MAHIDPPGTMGHDGSAADVSAFEESIPISDRRRMDTLETRPPVSRLFFRETSISNAAIASPLLGAGILIPGAVKYDCGRVSTDVNPVADRRR